nr:uncharacterized protein LOC131792578 [Pocillopora verrucosa]
MPLFFILLLCLLSVSVAKEEKECDIWPKGNSTAVEIINQGCTSVVSTSCNNATDHVTSVRLSNNKIEGLNATMFACFENLKELVLDGNLISDIPPGAFSGNAALEDL